MTFDLDQLNQNFEKQSATDILKWAFTSFDPQRIALSTSFGAEGMALMHMLISLDLKPRIFTLDTGRNFQETYDAWNEVVSRYGIVIEAYSPDPDDLKELLTGHGPNPEI